VDKEGNCCILSQERRSVSRVPAIVLSTTHQIHDRVDFIVTVQDIHQELVQLSHVSHREVFGVTNPLSKVAEDVWFGK
jgi:hypothetical protein